MPDIQDVNPAHPPQEISGSFNYPVNDLPMPSWDEKRRASRSGLGNACGDRPRIFLLPSAAVKKTDGSYHLDEDDSCPICLEVMAHSIRVARPPPWAAISLTIASIAVEPCERILSHLIP